MSEARLQRDGARRAEVDVVDLGHHVVGVDELERLWEHVAREAEAVLLVPPDEPALLEAGGGARRVEVAEDAVPAAARAQHGDHLLEQHGAGAAAALLGVDVDVLELADAEPHPPLQLHRRVVVHARPRLRHEDGAARAHAVVREDLEVLPARLAHVLGRVPVRGGLPLALADVGAEPLGLQPHQVLRRRAPRHRPRVGRPLVSEQHLHAAASARGAVAVRRVVARRREREQCAASQRRAGRDGGELRRREREGGRAERSQHADLVLQLSRAQGITCAAATLPSRR